MGFSVVFWIFFVLFLCYERLAEEPWLRKLAVWLGGKAVAGGGKR